MLKINTNPSFNFIDLFVIPVKKFLENDLIDGLYWETLYNKGFKNAPGQKIQPLNCPSSDIPATKPCPVDPADRNVMFENRMLGFPRLRMVHLIHYCISIYEEKINTINDKKTCCLQLCLFFS